MAKSISNPIGKVGSPLGSEATSDQFFFWLDRNALVEATQIVRTESLIGGEAYQFYAFVDQVYRVSDKANIFDEWAITDGNSDEDPMFTPQGVTYASARILRTQPNVFTPPLEQSKVFLCNEEEAALAYGADENEAPLSIGLIKNGGNLVAGAGQIDLNYLTGVNGGHLNVNGVAGRGTKSSFLLHAIYLLGEEAKKQSGNHIGHTERNQVVPIILNVKGYDLFFIDFWNKNYDPAKHRQAWQQLGIPEPKPFSSVTFLAPQMSKGMRAVPTGRNGAVQPYSWSLSNIIQNGLLLYLFADEDASDQNFSSLVLDIENWLTTERILPDGTIQRSLRKLVEKPKKTSKPAQSSEREVSPEGNNPENLTEDENPDQDVDTDITEKIPATFKELQLWVKAIAQSPKGKWALHHVGTWRKFQRRLSKLLYEGRGVLRINEQEGSPLNLARNSTSDPIVIDINSLSKVPGLQRFVVATIFNQLLEAQTGPGANSQLVYFIALDELNRFAPRGGRDPITKLIETVAAEMRSIGIILLGAQQQASKVSERVFENAGIHVVGRSGSLEMTQSMWRFINEKIRLKASSLQGDEKLIIQDSFREPMLVRIPFPPWAMRPGEVRIKK